MKILDLSDETTKINTSEYLVPRLYVAVITTNETAYKLLSESLKKFLLNYSEKTSLFSLEYKKSEIKDLLISEKIREKILATLSHERSAIIIFYI